MVFSKALTKVFIFHDKDELHLQNTSIIHAVSAYTAKAQVNNKCSTCMHSNSSYSIYSNNPRSNSIHSQGTDRTGTKTTASKAYNRPRLHSLQPNTSHHICETCYLCESLEHGLQGGEGEEGPVEQLKVGDPAQ